MTRRRTWMVGVALAASLAYVGAVDASEPARPGRVANTDGSNLRVRAAPSLDAPIVKRLGPGWRLTVLGEPSADGQWLRVEHGGTVVYAAVGYVAIEDVQAAEPSAPAGAVPPAFRTAPLTLLRTARRYGRPRGS